MVEEDHQTIVDLNKNYVNKRNDAKDLESEITAERKTFDPLWSDSVSGYTAAYKRDTDKYAQTTKDVQGTRVPDRKAEWKSVDEIECMLKTFKVHRSFTEEQLKECNERKVHVGHLKITYPATPAKEHQTLPLGSPWTATRLSNVLVKRKMFL